MSRIGAIEENGFAVLHRLFPSEYLDCVLEQINRLSPRRSRAGVRHALGLVPVEELARHQVLMELAVEVLGADVFPYRATLFDKSREANWLVVWHQDTALPLQSRRETPGWGPCRSKKGLIMHSLRQPHSVRFWRCVGASTIRRLKTGLSAFCHKRTRWEC